MIRGDPGEFFRNSPIRTIVVILRLRFILLWQVAVPLRGEGKRLFISTCIFDISPALEMFFGYSC